jgi:hypothetical protein
MSVKAILEFIKDDNGQMQLSFTPSNDQQLDGMARIASQAANMYVRSGGNMQSLIGSMGADVRQRLGSVLMNGFQGSPMTNIINQGNPMNGMPL